MKRAALALLPGARSSLDPYKTRASNRLLAVGLAALSLLTACSKRESTGTIVGPPLTYEPRDARAPSVDTTPSLESPVVATFIDLQARGAPVKVRPCEYVVVAVAKGEGNVAGEAVVVGDTVVLHGAGGFDVKGAGLALLAAIQEDACTAPVDDRMSKVVVKGSRAPELAWAGGAMHAHLDVRAELGKTAYVGRLEAAMAVPEHTHDASWEVLAAVEGKGTFTVAGKSVVLAPRSVVMVPPGTKHSFVPLEGTRLVAIQIYTPPGPEERFVVLAAPDAGR